jgi:hypothetical protein
MITVRFYDLSSSRLDMVGYILSSSRLDILGYILSSSRLDILVSFLLLLSSCCAITFSNAVDSPAINKANARIDKEIAIK